MVHDDDVLQLGDYIDEWLDRRRSQLRPSTLHGYRQTMDCYVRPRLGTVPLHHVDRRTLERLYARLLASGGVRGKSLSPRTVQPTHAILRRVLEDARLDGLIEENPADAARTPKRDPDQVQVDDDVRGWTAEQVRSFLSAVDESRSSANDSATRRPR